MMSKSSPRGQIFRHDAKNMSWWQKVHYFKEFIMTSKKCHDVKTFHEVKNTPWRQKVRHDIKKFVITLKFVMEYEVAPGKVWQTDKRTGWNVNPSVL